MAAKSYVPGLRASLSLCLRYLQRWQDQLQANLTTPQYDCMVAVINAILECVAALGARETE